MLVTFFRTSRTGTLSANKFDDSIIVTCFYDFSYYIFGKTAPSCYFVENDDVA